MALSAVWLRPCLTQRAAPNCHPLLFAEVLLAHIDERVLGRAGRIDAGKLDLIGRLGGAALSRTTEALI